MAVIESDYLAEVVLKGAVFVLVQVLVYVILSTSSNLFSRNRNIMRSFSFKPAPSSTINRILASISDLPLGGDQPPASTTEHFSSAKDHHQLVFPANYYNDQSSDYN
ncbi:hypothetical protein L484_000061 [Morus notabilis]|uniref:Uncharacterized protein n=1 Tax=Morus notabilis TaxID=981085 RepID=W9RI75_9ROSA|nr:uncharacterized protein LOC21390389 [Morus notabilis]EXB93500.1 hypothetical protein L484_006975 [Morus notabilis]EXC45821.1 hypothetical protein L484_000061 [Morus notabilis]